jgi:hypothetical protein
MARRLRSFRGTPHSPRRGDLRCDSRTESGVSCQLTEGVVLEALVAARGEVAERVVLHREAVDQEGTAMSSSTMREERRGMTLPSSLERSHRRVVDGLDAVIVEVVATPAAGSQAPLRVPQRGSTFTCCVWLRGWEARFAHAPASIHWWRRIQADQEESGG